MLIKEKILSVERNNVMLFWAENMKDLFLYLIAKRNKKLKTQSFYANCWKNYKSCELKLILW
jgi:hypothetical protein